MNFSTSTQSLALRHSRYDGIDDRSMPLFPKVMGSRSYRVKLRTFSRALRDQLLKDTGTKKPVFSYELTIALEHIVHSLAHVASYPATLEYVSMSRGKNDYCGSGRYSHLTFSSVILAVDLLVEGGFCKLVKGTYDRQSKTGVLSRLSSHRSMEDQMAKAGLIWECHPREITYSKPSGILFLKANDEKRALTRPANYLEQAIETQNSLIARTEVTLIFPDYDAYERIWTYGDNPHSKVSRGNIALYRQFVHDEESGGRILGHWVQNCPRDLRPNITFDGESVCEFDYKACQASLAYSHLGLTFDGDDLYAVPGFDEADRDTFKRCFTVGIGVDETQNPDSALAHKSRKDGEALTPGMAAKYMDDFWEFHSPIAQFKSNEGWRVLQLAESNLALKVLDAMASEKVATIPIHDGFLCASSKAGLLESAMREAVGHLTCQPRIERTF